MTYEYQREGGESLVVQNQGATTTIQMHSRGSSQQQSQSTGFQTGAWTEKPRLFRDGSEMRLVLATGDGTRTVRISRDGIRQESGDGAGEKGESLTLQEADDSAVTSMKPMRPMEPMKPLQPMAPMKPLF